MTAPLTDLEKIRRLPWLLAGDALNAGFYLLTFSGPVFLLFLRELELDEVQIGFLLSLVPFCGIIAPFIAPAVARFGYKRVFVTFWGLRKFVIALLLLVPWVVSRYGVTWAFYWVALTIFGLAICRAIAETGGYPWRKEAIPDAIRGKFSALNNMSSTFASILVIALASYIIGAGTGLDRFMIVIAVGIGLGLLAVAAYFRVPGGAPVPAGSGTTSHLQDIGQAGRDRRFLLFLAALGLGTLGEVAVSSFIPLFIKEQIGLSDGMVVLISIGTHGGALLSSYLWGWAADRYGSKPVMQFSLYLMLLPPVAWFLVPRHHPASTGLALAIAFAGGAAALAWQISWLRYLFVSATPVEKKSSYMAVYYAWFGFISGCAPLLAGQILGLSGGLRANLGPFLLDSYTPLFALSLGMVLAGIGTVARLPGGGDAPLHKFAGIFFRGNPIRAMESLIQYNFSGSELSRVATTERMGEARNPLSSKELIEALSDPSFNVRYEAILAIGRMPPEQELVDALLGLLEGPESELSSIAARTLGRLGDRRAIPPLRRALFSGYRLLEANSARALAALGDEASIPLCLDKLRRESNETLRVAYASALGKLRAGEATAELFELLRQTEADVLRGELGLALARIAGDERYYMQHWRSLRASPATATAQAVLALQKLARGSDYPALVTLTETCGQSFAQGDLAGGAAGLLALVHQVLPEIADPTLARILQGCVAGLAEFGPSRPELILLALHTLDITLHRSAPAVTYFDLPTGR